MFPRFVTFLTFFETLRTPGFPLPFLFLSEEWAIATLSKDTFYDVQKRGRLSDFLYVSLATENFIPVLPTTLSRKKP